MAEFRRVGGELVPHRQPGGRRMLLPAEAELCNAIGLSEDEYWHFVELTQAYNGERAKEYELGPDVRNDPVSIIVSLVIGAALSAVGALLAPKPRAPQQTQDQKAAPSLRTADVSGTRRFAPQSNFDSVQELSSLGAIIPLIFTRKGVRVTSTLLWSQMLSLGKGQQLRAIMLFGNKIEQRPDFAGIAIGDTLLENYTSAKLAMYFRAGGGRLLEPADRYPEGRAENLYHTDAFSIFWDRDGRYQPYFSGVRTPSTQTQFGAYSPMPSGNAFKVNYELTMRPREAPFDPIQRDVDTKRAKIGATFPCRAAVIAIDSRGATFRIAAGKEDPGAYAPWGLEDVNSSVESIRVNADEACSVGDLYLVGERFAVGHSSSTVDPWNENISKDFYVHWSDETPYTSAVERQNLGGRNAPYVPFIMQRAAVAVVSNNRDCDSTEVGLKSTVWKQINGFPNVNSQPDSGTIQSYEHDNGSISLGSISKYIKRLSFFRVFARRLGQNAAWTDINGGTVFCVEGQTPQAQYNYFRFVHPRGQYEFKFAPVPVNVVHRNYTNRDVWLLRPGVELSFAASGYTVIFSGTRHHLSPNAQSNSEWVLGSADNASYTQNSLNPYDAIADFTLYEAERTSHMDGPEHEIVYMSEQLQQVPPQYEDLAIAGLRINSTTEWTSFSSLSAFIKRGTSVQRLVTTGTSATNLLPEIAYALLTDASIGAGATIGVSQVDRDRMTLAARFCQANGFTWDGVISERINLREWIFEQAGYAMLDFTILGGRFSLVPSVPYNTDFTINYNGKPEIKALFTDGNIRGLKVTWLSPEERRLFKATCLWRKDKDNGFPETKVINVRLSDQEGGHDGDPEETFDMSGWCTTQEHAYTFARYALKLRQLVDHSVTFETTPQAAMNLAPGEYFRLVSEVTHTSRFNNGSIGPDGAIQSADLLNGSYPILYWEPGTVGVQSTTLTAVNGRTSQAGLFGTVFTLNNTTTVNRVYKVETLSYSENSLVEIAASHVPLTSSGSLAILSWSEDMFISEIG